MILIILLDGDLQDWINHQVMTGVSRFELYPSFIECIPGTLNVRMSREGDVVVALCSIDELLDALRFSKSLYIA